MAADNMAIDNKMSLENRSKITGKALEKQFIIDQEKRCEY